MLSRVDDCFVQLLVGPTDANQSLKPMSLPRWSSAEVNVIIQLAKGTIGTHVATHRCGRTLVSTFRFEPCNPSGLGHLPLHLPLSHLPFWPQPRSSRAGWRLPLPPSPNTATSSPASAAPLCPLWHTLGILCLPILTFCILVDLSRTLTRLTGNALDLTHSSIPGQEEAAREERQGKVGRLEGNV